MRQAKTNSLNPTYDRLLDRYHSLGATPGSWQGVTRTDSA